VIASRYRRIVFFFARVVASLIFWELVLPRVGLRGWSKRTRSERLRRIAVRFRALAIQMGGVLIKVGQFLSSRLDVMPEEITSELADLQDEVPPEKFADIRRVAEAELGAPLGERFAEFDERPLAAASLGQAHRARLHPQTFGVSENPEGLTVVVKVQRLNIELLIATDLAALRTVGNWLRRYPPIRRRADVPALLAEFTRTLGRVLRRPVALPVPALAVRIALGELADEALLASARVEPRALRASGYQFLAPELEAALRRLLARPGPPRG